jgi:hypothetical protein
MSTDRRRLGGEPQGILEYRASTFVRSRFRNGLERLKLTGYSIDWLEQKGWFGSVFFVRGHPAILAAIQKAIDRIWLRQTSSIHTERTARGTYLNVLA